MDIFVAASGIENNMGGGMIFVKQTNKNNNTKLTLLSLHLIFSQLTINQYFLSYLPDQALRNSDTLVVTRYNWGEGGRC